MICCNQSGFSEVTGSNPVLTTKQYFKYLDATKTDLLVKYVMIVVKLFTAIYSITANSFAALRWPLIETKNRNF